MPGSPLDIIEPTWLTEIARLLPELHQRLPDLPPPLALEPESAQTRLFDALGRLILAYARAYGPVLLCLDDLQWMDAASKAWLAHLGRFLKQGSPYPLLIVGTFRSEQNEAILELRQSLVHARILTEIQLSRLDKGAVLDLLRSVTGLQAGDEILADQLYQATGGNPFYLIETLHKLIEEGRLRAESRSGTGDQQSLQLVLPESVREAIQARLQLVSPIARQVLEAGAVLGLSFSLDRLRLTAGRSQIETMSAVDELTARALLVESQHEYRFIHELTRQHVKENLGRIRQRLLHLRAARAILRLDPEANLTLAHHYERGGDFARALDYYEAAAQKAKELYAWQEAESHYGRMLELLARLDPASSQADLVARRGAVLAERAHIYAVLGLQAERDADLQALSDLGEAHNDDALRLQAILNRLRYINYDGEYAWAIALGDKGLALLASSTALCEDQESSRLAKSRLLAGKGFGFYFLGRPQEALGHLEQAWDLCDEETDPESSGRILHILGYVYRHLGDYARSLEYQQRSYACHLALGDSSRMAWDLIDIGILQMDLGNLDQARQFLDQGLELARRVGSHQSRAYGLATLGNLDLYQGDYDEAVSHFQKVLELQQTAPSEHVLATAEGGIGFARYHLGEYGQSRQWLERALQRGRVTSNRRRTAKTLIQLGMLEIAEENLSQARWNLIEGLSISKSCQSGDCLAAGLAALARLERLSGDPECALDIALEAIQSSRQTGARSCEMWGEIEAGLDYLALQNLPAALEHTQRAVSLAPQACQDWIQRGEANRAYELVLHASQKP